MNFIETAYATNAEHAAPTIDHREGLAVTAAETHATTESADSGVLASLGINGSLFVAQLINFALVAAILWFLILKPLTKKMGERQAIIDESLENAKRVQENLAKSEVDYQAKIEEAKAEANKIIEKATADALKTADNVKAKTKTEIDELVAHAKSNIRIEKDEMVAGLRKETANLVVVALEKILSEKMNNEKDKKLIEEMVAKLK